MSRTQQMKLILESFRKYSKDQLIIEEAKKILKEQGINPCQSIDFNKLIIKAVDNPKNIAVFNALRKAIFGAHKKSKKKSKSNHGIIEIVNNSGHDLYDFRVLRHGPHVEDWQNTQNIKMETYNIPRPIDDPPYNLLQGGGDRAGGAHIPAGESLKFSSPTGTLQIRYIWFPERFFKEPYVPNDDQEAARELLARQNPKSWNGETGENGRKEGINLPAMAVQPMHGPDGKAAPPLKGGVIYRITINPDKFWPEGSIDPDEAIRTPAPSLEVEGI